MPYGSRDTRRSVARRGHRWLGLAALLICGAVLLPAPSSAGNIRGTGNRGDGLLVDHDGIYLSQRIGQCMNGSGPCYFGGQCPGGEYTTNRYANGRVYCSSFIPPAPYPPTLFQSLLGIK